MTLKEYQRQLGIKRIMFDRVKATGLEDTYADDSLECPYCNATFGYEAEEENKIVGGTAYQCPFCEKYFYAYGEVHISTTCTPMEDKVIDSKGYIESMYRHIDQCEAKGMEFDPEMKKGFVEWDTYDEYARPLFENAEKNKEDANTGNLLYFCDDCPGCDQYVPIGPTDYMDDVEHGYCNGPKDCPNKGWETT